MEIIKVEIDHNYVDRHGTMEWRLEIMRGENNPNNLLFSLYYKEREDDDIIISVDISDLFSALGKILKEEE